MGWVGHEVCLAQDREVAVYGRMSSSKSLADTIPALVERHGIKDRGWRSPALRQMLLSEQYDPSHGVKLGVTKPAFERAVKAEMTKRGLQNKQVLILLGLCLESRLPIIVDWLESDMKQGGGLLAAAGAAIRLIQDPVRGMNAACFVMLSAASRFGDGWDQMPDQMAQFILQWPDQWFVGFLGGHAGHHFEPKDGELQWARAFIVGGEKHRLADILHQVTQTENASLIRLLRATYYLLGVDPELFAPYVKMVFEHTCAAEDWRTALSLVEGMLNACPSVCDKSMTKPARMLLGQRKQNGKGFLHESEEEMRLSATSVIAILEPGSSVGFIQEWFNRPIKGGGVVGQMNSTADGRGWRLFE